jgi:RNA polymerase sigma factor (sigma-70 family)
MTANDQDLLGQFTLEHSQDAFTALVNRHLNLVYSAALRQVRSAQLAEEVSQSVFTQLARTAPNLAPDTVLTAWLYQVTRHSAIDVVRREARRQAREQIAFQMSAMNDSASDWSHIEPLLDEAMQSLDEPDRTAILLRYFENKSLREVGEALGASEDAAQKRVGRAVERLRESLFNRKVTVGASCLATLLSANAIQAAPVGFAAAVATTAAAAGTAALVSTAVTTSTNAVIQTITMTTLQKTIVAAVLATAIGTGLYQASQASRLRQEVQTLKKQQANQTALSNQFEEIQLQRDRATNALAALVAEQAKGKKGPNEVLKLRGEVGRLRQENAQIGSSSALSKVTADPQARQILRDQQKMGMGAIYKGLANQMKLTSEQTGKLNDLLADHIMNDVDHVTTILRDKTPPQQMNELFATQEAALHQKVEELLGADGLKEYQDYSKNLLSNLTAEQFKGMLSGTGDEKQEKANQLRQILQEEAQSAVAAAGLPADYQTVPILNFANIASETAGEQSLKLLGDIYERAIARGKSFLNEADLAKFQEFQTTAINNNRSALMLNRTMMAPISN